MLVNKRLKACSDNQIAVCLFLKHRAPNGRGQVRVQHEGLKQGKGGRNGSVGASVITVNGSAFAVAMKAAWKMCTM